MNSYSRDELETIINEYGDHVYRLAYIYMKQRDLADDIYQDVFLRLIRSEQRIEPPEHLKSWLFRTTINCCKDVWKSNWFRMITFSGVSEDKGEDILDSIPSTESTQNDQDQGFITECVCHLPEKYRTVIHLYYYEEYSIREMAALLGKPENTISSQLARGREMLRKQISAGKGTYYDNEKRISEGNGRNYT